MRDSTKFCIGEGKEGFFSLLKGYFPSGKMAYIANKIPIDMRFSDKYRVQFVSIEDTLVYQKSEEIRLVIGEGKLSIKKAVERFYNGVKYCFIAENIDFRYLIPFPKKNFGEFVYIDKNNIQSNIVQSTVDIYASIFSLWCEIIIRLYDDSFYPFCDKTLLGLREQCEFLLDGKVQKDDFFEEGIRLISHVTNTLFAKNSDFYVLSIAPENATLPYLFVSSYFLIHLAINFTKYPLRDILIPSEDNGQKINGLVFREKDVFPPKEKLLLYLQKMKSIQVLPTVFFDELLLSYKKSTLPLVREWKEKGVLEGLLYEEFGRN